MGADVGRRARAWLGDGTYLPRAPLDDALAATAKAVSTEPTPLMFEASFSALGLIARADAIRRTECGWTIVEVKSGKSKESGEIKQEHIDDVAYTVCVAAKAGLPVTGAAIVLLNRDYRVGGSAEMFTEFDVSVEALQRAKEFEMIAADVATCAGAASRPDPTFRFICKDCDYYETECVGKGISDPLFLLPYLKEKKFAELRDYGSISKIPSSAKLTDNQKRIVEIIQLRQPRTDVPELRKILREVVWPVRYLDFEAVMPYLPWFESSPPYDTAPFQYSLHVRTDPHSEPTHREFLASLTGDWRRTMTEQLLEDLGTSGSIVVYSSYEKTRINALAGLFPDLSERLSALVPRLFDLERVFKDAHQHPEFGGRTSIKNVLPVMVPGLSYSTLEVNNGDDAMGVFALMRIGVYGEELHETYRERLLEYCKLDTTAMLRLHEAVITLAGDSPLDHA